MFQFKVTFRTAAFVPMIAGPCVNRSAPQQMRPLKRPDLAASTLYVRAPARVFHRGLDSLNGFLSPGAVRANSSDLRAVHHSELAQDLVNMNFDGSFPDPQPARNGLVGVATAHEFEDRVLPRC